MAKMFAFPSVKTLQEMLAGQRALGRKDIEWLGLSLPGGATCRLKYDEEELQVILYLDIRGEILVFKEPADSFPSDTLEAQLMLVLG